MGDRDHELQMLLRELVRGALLDNPLRCDRSINVDDADDIVTALHGNADRFSDAHAQDAFGGIPAVVFAGITCQYAFTSLDHVIQNRLADTNPLVRWQSGHAAAFPADL